MGEEQTIAPEQAGHWKIMIGSVIAGSLGMLGIALGAASGTRIGYAAAVIGLVGALVAAKTLLELREYRD